MRKMNFATQMVLWFGVCILFSILNMALEKVYTDLLAHSIKWSVYAVEFIAVMVIPMARLMWVQTTLVKKLRAMSNDTVRIATNWDLMKFIESDEDFDQIEIRSLKGSIKFSMAQLTVSLSFMVILFILIVVI